MRNIYFTPEFEEDISNEENSIELTKYLISPYLKDSRTGQYIHPVTKERMISPSQIDMDFMQGSNPSPQTGTYSFEAIYNKVGKNLKIYLPSLLNTDSGIKLDNETRAYRILYFLYSSSFSRSSSSMDSDSSYIDSTGEYEEGNELSAPRDSLNTAVDKLAFIIYDRLSRPGASELRLNPLYLSRHRNLISIDIDMKCEVLTKKDTDTKHLEGTGVDGNYSNIFSIKVNGEGADSTYIDKESYKRYYYNSISSNDPYYGGVTINKFGLRSY